MRKNMLFITMIFVFLVITSISVFADNESEFTYSVAEDGTAVITGYTGKLKGLAIPENIDGYDVTVIGDSAFKGDENLVSIILPEGLTEIGEAAFEDCYNLEEIEIPESVKRIGAYAFKHVAIKEIDIPQAVTEIEDNTFYGCSILKKVFLGEGVKKIGNYAFAECSFLERVSLPSTVESIGEYAFYKCTSLIRLNIPAGIRTIGIRAFNKCTDLYSFSVSEDNPVFFENDGALYERQDNGEISLLYYPPGKYSSAYYIFREATNISNEAFVDCTKVESVIVTSNVKSIDTCAFSGCTNLKRIYIQDSVLSLGENVFYGCENLNVIYYSGSEEQWNQISKDGNDFSNIELEYDTFIAESVLGDVNSDGRINASDALLIIKYSAKIIELDKQSLVLADVSKDGSVNAKDALMILKYSCALIEEF